MSGYIDRLRANEPKRLAAVNRIRAQKQRAYQAKIAREVKRILGLEVVFIPGGGGQYNPDNYFYLFDASIQQYVLPFPCSFVEGMGDEYYETPDYVVAYTRNGVENVTKLYCPSDVLYLYDWARGQGLI